MTIDTVLSVVTVTALGLMVGVELAVALVLNRILNRLPVGASVSGRAHGGRLLGRVMPIWYLTSLTLTVVLAVRTWGSASSLALVTAAAGLTTSVVLSVALLVPVNDRVVAWTEDAHPDDWREQLTRWDRLHDVRVAVLVVVYLLVVAAATVAR